MKLLQNIFPGWLLLLFVVQPSIAQQHVSTRVPAETWLAFEQTSDAGFTVDLADQLIEQCVPSGASAVLVIYDGAVLFSWGDVEKRYMCHSCRKSFMSMLYGIHVAEELIDLEKSLAELGIDDKQQLSAEEQTATVSDLLKSRSGIYHPAAYEPQSMKNNRPERGSHIPGEHWWYNNWDFNTSLTILEQEAGEKFFESFDERIAQPIGLQDFRLGDGYYHLEPESMHPAYPFRLSARDMARIGLLMANGGRWADQQIIPPDWVRESTEPHSETGNWNGFSGYGFMWWIGTAGGCKVFSAQGTGGNSIYIISDRKLVFVFRADTFKGGSTGSRPRWNIVNAVLDAQSGAATGDPKLVEVEDTTQLPDPVELSDEYLAQFPLDIRRHLPESLPAAIRDEPVRIALEGDVMVVYTRRPPALQFDLIPLAEDRFWICTMDEIGVIDRDRAGNPRRFVVRGDLEAHIKELENAGQTEEAARERLRLLEVFPQGPSEDR
ncbi:MAG: serine hydrolase [Planctomycetota bacterium]